MTDACRWRAAIDWHPEKDDATQSSSELRSLGERRWGGQTRSRKGAAERAVLEREQYASIGVAAEHFHARERQWRRLQVGNVQLVDEEGRAVAAGECRCLGHAHLDARRQLGLPVRESSRDKRKPHERKGANTFHQSMPTRPFTAAISFAES